MACFRNAAAHLEPGGLRDRGLRAGAATAPAGRDRVAFTSARAARLRQVRPRDPGRVPPLHRWATARERSIPFRYVWPAELDLMARLAGLALRERWAAGNASRSRATASTRLGLGENGGLESARGRSATRGLRLRASLPPSEGWFVVNVRDAEWGSVAGRRRRLRVSGSECTFEGRESKFRQSPSGSTSSSRASRTVSTTPSPRRRTSSCCRGSARCS